MELAELRHIAHTHHPIAAPVSQMRASALLARLPVPEGGTVLDFGCGRGEWLLMLLARRPDLTAIGVDTNAFALASARAEAASRGLNRTQWEHADAVSWPDERKYDAVVCIGASHAFGGLRQTLDALRAHMKPGGHALVGDSFWERAPNAAAQAALEIGPDELPSLAGLTEIVTAGGWEPVSGHTSTDEEWDDYEWSWTGSLAEWSLRRPYDDDASQARELATRHRSEWLNGYRGQLGFVTLVLADTRSSDSAPET